MKKKLLFVNSSLTGGGSERVMTLLANYCAENGYDVHSVAKWLEGYYLSKANGE